MLLELVLNVSKQQLLRALVQLADQQLAHRARPEQQVRQQLKHLQQLLLPKLQPQ
jgi:hypothetical protein